MKKTISFLLCFCVLFVLFFCNIKSHALYITLDDTQITTFVRAEFTGDEAWVNEERYIKFKTNELLFGVAENEIWLKSFNSTKENKIKPNPSAPSGRSPYDYEYIVGEEYLLLARKILDVYMPFDYYEPKDNYYVMVDGLYGLGSCYPNSNSEIWWQYYEPYMQGEPDALSDEEILRLFINQVVDYLNETSEGKTFYGYECIRTDDLTLLEAKAPDIIRVYVEKKQSESKEMNTEVRECRVLEVLQGDCAEAEITVQFFKDDVKHSGEYIIYAIERNDNTKHYYLYAPHAVKTVSEPWVGTIITVISIITALCGVAVTLTCVLVSVFKLRKKK